MRGCCRSFRQPGSREEITGRRDVRTAAPFLSNPKKRSVFKQKVVVATGFLFEFVKHFNDDLISIILYK